MKKNTLSILVATATLGLAVSGFAMPKGTNTTISQAKTISPQKTDYVLLNNHNLVAGGIYNINCTLSVAEANGAYAKVDAVNVGGAALSIDGGSVSTGAQQDLSTGVHLLLVANATIAPATSPELLEIHNLDSVASIDVSACVATPVV
jgi:hypothetical protein